MYESYTFIIKNAVVFVFDVSCSSIVWNVLWRVFLAFIVLIYLYPLSQYIGQLVFGVYNNLFFIHVVVTIPFFYIKSNALSIFAS